MLSDDHASVLRVHYEECVPTNQKQDRRLSTAAPSALDYRDNQRDLRRLETSNKNRNDCFGFLLKRRRYNRYLSPLGFPCKHPCTHLNVGKP